MIWTQMPTSKYHYTLKTYEDPIIVGWQFTFTFSCMSSILVTSNCWQREQNMRRRIFLRSIFRRCNTSLEDEGGRVCRFAIDNQHLELLIEKKSPCQSVRKMSQIISVSILTISNYRKKIGKAKKSDKWVQNELGESQRVRRF